MGDGRVNIKISEKRWDLIDVQVVFLKHLSEHRRYLTNFENEFRFLYDSEE